MHILSTNFGQSKWPLFEIIAPPIRTTRPVHFTLLIFISVPRLEKKHKFKGARSMFEPTKYNSTGTSRIIKENYN